MTTEQTKVTVEFTIHELLHIYDQLIIARDYGDDVELCDYLCDRITMETPYRNNRIRRTVCALYTKTICKYNGPRRPARNIRNSE